MSKYKLGKMSFEKKESKELFILRHLLSDYEYLLKMNKTILSDGDKELFKELNKELGKIIKNKSK